MQQTIVIRPPARATNLDAYGLNDSDEIVGNVYNSTIGPLHAFHGRAGVLTDLTDAIGAPHTRVVAHLFRGNPFPPRSRATPSSPSSPVSTREEPRSQP